MKQRSPPAHLEREVGFSTSVQVCPSCNTLLLISWLIQVSFLRDQVQTLTRENESLKLQLQNTLHSPPPTKLGMREFCNSPLHDQVRSWELVHVVVIVVVIVVVVVVVIIVVVVVVVVKKRNRSRSTLVNREGTCMTIYCRLGNFWHKKFFGDHLQRRKLNKWNIFFNK